MSASIKSLLSQNNGEIRLLEAHDYASKEVVSTAVGNGGQSFQGIWMSGLTQTTYLGIPDTELISPLERAILTSKLYKNSQQGDHRPLGAAYDADSGGNIADIPSLVAILAKTGVSMIIIEDKGVSEPGQKVNSLIETFGHQDQADMHHFAKVIRAFKSASAGKDMMITARIESFTVQSVSRNKADGKPSLQDVLRDALTRAEVYRNAQADAIMIHSKSASPDEVLAFLTEYRARDPVTPLVVVPTSYSKTIESTLFQAGVNVIIYANHLMRAKMDAIREFSEKSSVRDSNLFSQHADLSDCLRVQNFGCLLQKMLTRDLSGDARQYRVTADKLAAERMRSVAKKLLDGKMAGAADKEIISVKELLRINAHQVSDVEKLTGDRAGRNSKL